jgi:hypothetical protein
VADEAREEDEAIKRGPKGGRKHQPGRGHDRKSSQAKTARFRRSIRARKKQRDEEARRKWQEYDQLSDEQRRLLGSKGIPKMPRPRDES